MKHHPYLERAAHLLAAVALAVGLLGAVPVLDALSQSPAEIQSSVGDFPAARVEEGDLVARVTVPGLALDTPVYEGVHSRTLASGAGHLPGTPLPGEDGARRNSVIAIPRDAGPTAALADLQIGEGVQMRTPFGRKSYRVTQRRVVPPERVRLGQTARPRVTFVTTYPADSIGPAPLRLAVILEPAGDGESVASVEPAPRAPRARSASLRRPARLQRAVRPAANQLSSAWRNSETRPTGRAEISAYSEASEAFPAGR
jgi:sortase A